MNIALVGCGFVADYYLTTLPAHPELRVVGIVDQKAERARLLSSVYGLHSYASVDDLLDDPRVELVLNLTNPHSHYDISRAALLAGKHVYSEKPLAMQLDQAAELVELANARGLIIASAPCSLLGETAQTLWRLLRGHARGRVRVVYAEMDDGMVPRMPYRKWKSASGVEWPYKDEFEVGCTLEHAGYYLSWLVAWFGPALEVTRFASVQYPDKLPQEMLKTTSPDFSVACIQFASGVVARLTCSILAPHDHSLTIVCDDGILLTRDCWDYRSPVYTRRMMSIRRRTLLSPILRRHRLAASPYRVLKTRGAQRMDFARGPAELAASIREKRTCRLSPQLSLHVTELALAIHDAPGRGALYRMTTTCEPVEPMPWSK